MHAGRNGLAKLKENMSQTHIGTHGNNRKKCTVERIPGRQTSRNPSRSRTPHQKDHKETEPGGQGALEPERGILGLKQPETKVPTALTPATRDQEGDLDPTGAREKPEKAAANLGQTRRVMISMSFLECRGTEIGPESPRTSADSRKDGRREITPTKETQTVNGRRGRQDKPGDLRPQLHLQTRSDGPLLPNQTTGSEILELDCNNKK